MSVCVSCLWSEWVNGKNIIPKQPTGLSASQTNLCVSKTNISINAVFPWCKCPTTATFRIISGNPVMFNRKLYPFFFNLLSNKWLKQGLPFVKSCFRHVLLLDSPFSYFYRSNNGFRKRLRVFFLDQSLNIGPIYIGGGWIILLVFMQDDSVVYRFWITRW